MLNGGMCTGNIPCTSDDRTDPGLDGRGNGGGAGELWLGRRGWKKAEDGGIPSACPALANWRGVKRDSDGGGVNSSPETRGFCVRDREETIDPDLVCGAALDMLPL